MPIVEESTRIEAPREPHLGLLVRGGTVCPIPPGAMIYVVEDPTRADKVMPLVLAKVSAKAIDFVCGCGQPKCSRRIRYRAEKSGHHPPIHQTHSTVQSKDE